jgi:serine protease Do
MNIPRKVTENDQGSRITSYGEPFDVSRYTDSYGRAWKISMWQLEYLDRVVINFTIPTPNGLTIMYVSCASSQVEYFLYDLKKIVDYIAVSYGGMVDEWQTFLQQKDFLFGPMKGVSVSCTENTSIDVATQGYSFRVNQGLMKITKKSNIFLGFALFVRDGKVVCDVQNATVDESDATGDNNYCLVNLWMKPDDQLPDTYKTDWQTTVVERGYPYNSRAFSSEGRTNIGGILPLVSKNHAYALFAAKEGSVPDDEMGRYLRDFMGSMKVSY